jgi:succinoglycan biosynthesis protein ExoM
MILSVCIATYKRPELLSKLLDSLAIQKNVEDYSIEIIVVENDVEALSKDVVENFKRKISFDSRFIVRYDIQPIKNIALTRNKSLELASGELIFFIDDDEYADENCISSHVHTLTKFNADATFGNVVPYFNDKVPNYIKGCSPYFRINNISGENTKFFITGNTLLKRNVIKKNNILFNPEYGITGGSDNDFFVRLKLKRTKLLSCAEATVFELIPLERANIKWLIKRVFRTGNNYTRTLIFKNGKQSFYLSITQFIKGLLQFIIAFFLAVIFIWNRTKSLNWFLKSVSNISKPFAVFGYYPQEYKN